MMAGFTEAGLNAQADGLAGKAKYAALHTADPGTGGGSESSAGRKQLSWSTASGGAVEVGSVKFTGGAASGACTHVGLWSAASGGTFYGSAPLTGDQTFNSSGEYTVDSLKSTDVDNTGSGS
jgi:hypothetical protein